MDQLHCNRFRQTKDNQNVRTVCSFGMRFTWSGSGSEWYSHDWKIFTKATTRPDTSFLTPQPVQLVEANHSKFFCYMMNLIVICGFFLQGNTIQSMPIIQTLEVTSNHTRKVSTICKIIMVGDLAGPKKFSIIYTSH